MSAANAVASNVPRQSSFHALPFCAPFQRLSATFVVFLCDTLLPYLCFLWSYSMKVTVFGIGYVGLVQAAVLAEVGHDVVCVDINAERVENLKKGIIPIYEPGLTPLVQRNYEAGRLQFTTDAAHGVQHGRIQFIAVGTPPDEDGSADLQYVLAVAKTIRRIWNRPRLLWINPPCRWVLPIR